MAWLERLAAAVNNRGNDINSDMDSRNNTVSSGAGGKVSKLTDSGHSEIVQAKIIQMKQDYRQLRYGRLSSLETNDSEYQVVLKQLKKDASELF